MFTCYLLIVIKLKNAFIIQLPLPLVYKWTPLDLVSSQSLYQIKVQNSYLFTNNKRNQIADKWRFFSLFRTDYWDKCLFLSPSTVYVCTWVKRFQSLWFLFWASTELNWRVKLIEKEAHRATSLTWATMALSVFKGWCAIWPLGRITKKKPP